MNCTKQVKKETKKFYYEKKLYYKKMYLLRE